MSVVSPGQPAACDHENSESELIKVHVEEDSTVENVKRAYSTLVPQDLCNGLDLEDPVTTYWRCWGMI
jgi:hypothetical protein